MEKEMILSPEELYYMGSVLQAKYIDYAYVAAMSDIKQNYALFEKETQASLVSAGVLMEDFSGNLEIDERVRALLNPIFFGEVETSLDVCHIGDVSTVEVCKFHFHDGTATMVTGENGKLLIKAIDQLGIQNKIDAMIPASYEASREVTESIDKEKITRLIAAKSVVVGKSAVVKTYIESEGVLYQENGTQIESVTKEMFSTDVYNVIKGV